MIGKKLCYCEGIFGMCFHSDCKSFDATQGHETIKRSRDGSTYLLHFADVFKEIIIVSRYNNSAYDIAMTAKIFSGCMENKVGTELKRSLKDGSCKCIIANTNCIM